MTHTFTIRYLLGLFLIGTVFLFPENIIAQSGSTFSIPPSGATTGTPPSGYTTNSTFILPDPLGIKNFCDLVKKLLDIVVAIGIPVAVFFLVWAGFKFIIARGNPTELETAKKNFYYVIIGIGVFLGAWTLATVLSATIQTLDSSGTIQFCGR